MNVKDSDLDDRELIEQFKRSGDPEWFARLFERYQRLIHGISWAMLRNQALAEDAVQETFKNAFKELGRFNEMDGESNFAAWLRTICRNVCFSILRRKTSPVLDLPDPPALAHVGPEDLMLFQQLEAELKAMEDGPRRCWLMFYVEGYTYQEISERTGYSPQEVKNHIRVARERLRKRLK